MNFVVYDYTIILISIYSKLYYGNVTSSFCTDVCVIVESGGNKL